MLLPGSGADALLRAVELVATLAFALSGFAAAARKRMDIVGICSVAFIAAFGGGTLRDVLLDKRPFFWVQQSGWVWAILAICTLGALAMRSHHVAFTERAIRLPDAVGLGLFSAVGTGQALQADAPTIVAALMGVVTAVFGGVMRDILCNEIPAVFRDHRPYAVCAFAGAWTFVALDALALPHWVALAGAASAATVLRLLAIARGWQVPGWRED